MAKIQRYNVVLDVEDSEVDYYINLGYNLLDDKGAVVKAAMPTDVHTLQSELIKANAKIADLENTIKTLKSSKTQTQKGKTV